MRLGTRYLGYSLLLLTLLTTPSVSSPESASTAPAADAAGPVQHPAGNPAVPVAPRALRSRVVPANLSRPAANYQSAPRSKTAAGPRAAEVPAPKQIKPRAKLAVDPAALSAAPGPAALSTPPLAISFDSLDFDSNAAHSGFVFTPPDSSGAAGPAHVVGVTNVSLAFHDKATGAVTFEGSLASFFAPLAPLTFTFDPKVVYDQFAGRFVIVTLERTAVGAGDPADTSRILLAASEDGDPNGTWYLTAIDASEVFFNPAVGATADHWVDYPGLAVDEEAVYITGNMFAFSGQFGGVRLWVVDKGLGTGGLYDGGAAAVALFDPYAGCGPGVDCFAITTQPAHVFGAAPTTPTNVGTWLVSYSGISDGLGAGLPEYVQVVRVDDPVGPGTTTFTQEFVGVGDIEDPFAADLPGAEQLGLLDTIATNDRGALSAVWRDNDRLYLSATILPVTPDPDAGQATAHWFQLDTAALSGLTLIDQGNVGGEDIHATGSVHTFFPSISVNDSDALAIGFSASSASIYAGSYYAAREAADAPGSIGPSFTLRAGLAPFLRTFCGTDNRWGDYSGMSVDPVDQCFWVYNQHAAPTGTPTPCPGGSEDGRWATAFGKFCGAACGDATVDAGETCDPPGQPAGASGNLCRVDCTVCGDGVVDAGEACDDGNAVNDDFCLDDCTAPVCGDGLLSSGEACDDGNLIDGDGCESDCTTTPSCGDGLVNLPGETCDPPAQPAGASGNPCRGDCTVCGDGVTDAGEACDDGNAADDDACRNDCTVPACGDGIVDAQNDETCDPPGTPAGVNANECRVDCKVCGDGVVDPGEDCDDANTDDLDACRNTCSAPRCGDGIVDAQNDETCDPPGQPAGASGNNCRGDCSVCGDGAVDPGEACDDGNADNLDACRNDCALPACGDGIVDAGEACDDGNPIDGDGCQADCTVTPVCGDGLINVTGETCEPPGDPAGANGNDCRNDCTVCGDGVPDPGESCDDGNGVDDDACRNDCSAPTCGDGIVDAQMGETCDPPAAPGGVLGNSCRSDCTVCGDGVTDPVEECDDGNAFNFDGCRNSCDLPACGDGIVDPTEDCDDGNAVDGDGCESDCTETPVCGDLAVNAPGETCDPPGQPAGPSGNLCRGDCTVCGDGVTDPGEECDDANAIDGDGCRNACLLPACGDGIVDAPDETCDPPGLAAGASGNACRGDCTVCGDGRVDAGEACDDGNADNLDACRNDCTAPACGDGIVDAGEACDDGNAVGGDGCENDCTVTPVCGDGAVNAPDETCDPPGQPGGAAGNLCRGDCTVCGDGVLDVGEACDDGNADNADACRNDCTPVVCGDGILDAPDETCDPPGQPAGAVGNDCRADCTVCGDGAVDPGEECDDGNAFGFDGCRNDCTAPFCGDGIVDPAEDCDDGNLVDGDGCESDCTETPFCGDAAVNAPGETCDPPGQPAGAAGNACREDCTVCGDGVQDAGEACDDGNATHEDACRNDCVLAACGDGIVDVGEACDDGNLVDGDGCESDCTETTACGDGVVNAVGETCDPPGQPAGATGRACRDDCTVCGDGVTDPGEDCDDGNADNLDGCRNNCRLPRCGDRIVDAPETCDPPGQPAGVNGNNCRSGCTVCGDGIVNGSEQCDDGNTSNFDGCRNNCTIPACGDGVLDPGDEECDDGNAIDGDGCEATCLFTRAGSLTSLIFSRIPGNPEITLSWGPSCRTSDTDYEIYEGTFPNFATHVPRTCSTGGSQTATFVPATHSTYYLLVPRNSRVEGSYGSDSLGNQRAVSTAACKPRRLAVCE